MKNFIATLTVIMFLAPGCSLQSRHEPFVKSEMERHVVGKKSRVSIFKIYTDPTNRLELSRQLVNDSMSFLLSYEVRGPQKNGSHTDVSKVRPTKHIALSTGEADTLLHQYDKIKLDVKEMKLAKREVLYVDYTVNDSLVVGWKVSTAGKCSMLWLGHSGDRVGFKLSTPKLIKKLKKNF